MTTQLAPCPFCGSEATCFQPLESWYVARCTNTECSLWVNSVPLHQWNSRPDLLRIKELEEKVRELERKLQSTENEIEDMKPNLSSGKMTGWRL